MKKWKKCLVISSFTLVYRKWQSYNKWFLRNEARQTEFWGILGIFCPFNPLTTPKIKILKKWKKCLEISSFYTSVPKMMIICYTLPEIQTRDGFNFYFSFWAVFCPLTTLTFLQVYQKLWSNDTRFLRYGARKTDGQMDW